MNKIGKENLHKIKENDKQKILFGHVYTQFTVIKG